MGSSECSNLPDTGQVNLGGPYEQKFEQYIVWNSAKFDKQQACLTMASFNAIIKLDRLGLA